MSIEALEALIGRMYSRELSLEAASENPGMLAEESCQCQEMAHEVATWRAALQAALEAP